MILSSFFYYFLIRASAVGDNMTTVYFFLYLRFFLSIKFDLINAILINLNINCYLQ